MSKYSLLHRSRAGSLLAKFDEVLTWSVVSKISEAGQMAVEVPFSSDKSAAPKVGEKLEIFLGRRRVAKGIFQSRDIGNESVSFGAMTSEILLENAITPPQYGAVFNDMTLQQAVDHLLEGQWVISRSKGQYDFNNAHDSGSVEYFSSEENQGVVTLNRLEPGDDSTPPVYETQGFIVYRYSKAYIPGFKHWERIRWVADHDVAEPSGDKSPSQPELVVEVWYRGYMEGEEPADSFDSITTGSSSFTALGAGSLTDTIGNSAILGETWDHLEVVYDLSTTDENWSPALYSAEVIARAEDTSWLADVKGVKFTAEVHSFIADEVIQGIDANEKSALGVLVDICEQGGWEFILEDTVLTIAKEVGTDKSSEVHFRAGDDVEVEILSETDEGMVNRLRAYGPGVGLKRMMVNLENAASIEKYGIYPGTKEFPGATDETDLVTRADEWLQENSETKISFSVRPAHGSESSPLIAAPRDEPVYSVGDYVTVTDPRSYISEKVRILEVSRAFDGTNVRTQLKLGKVPPQPFGYLRRQRNEALRRRKNGVPRPTGVIMWKDTPGLSAKVNRPEDSPFPVVAWDWFLSLTPGFAPSDDNLVATGAETRRKFENLAPGVSHYLRVRAIDEFGNRSRPSSQVMAVAGQNPPPPPGSVGEEEIADGGRLPRSGVGPPTEGMIRHPGQIYIQTDIFPQLLWVVRFNPPSNALEWTHFIDNVGPVKGVNVGIGAIGPGKISKGAVRRAEILDGEIVAGKLGNDAVIPGAIAEGAVRAREIQNGSLALDKFSGINLDNLILNGNFTQGEIDSEEDPHKYHVVGGSFYGGASTFRSGDKALMFITDGMSGTARVDLNGHRVDRTRHAQATPGDQFYLETWCYKVGSGVNNGIGIQMEFRDATGGILYVSSNNFGSQLTDSFQKFSVKATAPEGVAYVAFVAYIQVQPGISYIGFDSFYARRVIGSNVLGDGAVTHGKISAEAVRRENILNGEIVNSKLPDGAVDNRTIGLGQVGPGKFATGAVRRADILDGEIVNSKLPDGAVDNRTIGLGQVGPGKFATGAIRQGDILDGEIVAGKFGPGAVRRADILDGEIVNSKLIDGAVDNRTIGLGQVGPGKLGTNAVQVGNIAEKTIRSRELDDRAVGGAALDDGAITFGKLAGFTPDNLILNSNFSLDGIGTSKDPHHYVEPGGSWHTTTWEGHVRSGGRACVYGTTNQFGTARIDLNGPRGDPLKHPRAGEGDEFHFECWAKTSSGGTAGNIGIQIEFRDSTGGIVNAASTNFGDQLNFGYQKFAVKATAAQGVAYAAFVAYVAHQPDGLNVIFDSFYARRVVDSNVLGDGAVVQGKFGPGAVRRADILDGEIVNSKLPDGAVNNRTIGLGQVGPGKLGTNAVRRGNILDGEIVNSKLPDGAVNNRTIGPGQVGPGKLGTNAVRRENILDGEIVAGKFGPGAIKRADILDGEIVNSKLIDGAVNDRTIGLGQVGPGKLGTDAVQAGNVSSKAIRNRELDDSSVDEVKLSEGAVSPDKFQSFSADNLIFNPTFAKVKGSQDPHYYETAGGSWYNGGVPHSGEHGVVYATAAQTGWAKFAANGNYYSRNRHVACRVGEKFYFELWAYAVGAALTNTVELRIIFYTASAGYISTVYRDIRSQLTGAYKKFNLTAEVPDGAAYIVFDVAIRPQSGTSYIVIDDLLARRVLDHTVVQQLGSTSVVNDSGIEIQDAGGTRQVKLGNIAGLPGVPPGVDYGLAGRAGTGIFIENVPRQVSAGSTSGQVSYGSGPWVQWDKRSASMTFRVWDGGYAIHSGRKLVGVASLTNQSQAKDLVGDSRAVLYSSTINMYAVDINGTRYDFPVSNTVLIQSLWIEWEISRVNTGPTFGFSTDTFNENGIISYTLLDVEN